jgi:hypothetical protein
VQVDPIKPVLQPPGIKRLTLKYDDPLSNFAFKFKLRRYNNVAPETVGQLYFKWIMPMTKDVQVGWCRLAASRPELKARLVPVLETKMW